MKPFSISSFAPALVAAALWPASALAAPAQSVDLGRAFVLDAALDARSQTILLSRDAKTQSVSRLRSDGTRDAAFDLNARRALSAIARGELARVASQTVDGNGKIVLIGTLGNARGVFAARLNADGTLDETFGERGARAFRSAKRFQARALAIDSQNRVLLGAQEGEVGARDWRVLRFSPSGALDTTFGTNGVAANNRAGDQTLTSLQSAGATLLLGGIDGANAFVSRLNTDGARDRDFGTDGIARLASANSQTAAQTSKSQTKLQAFARDVRTGALAVLLRDAAQTRLARLTSRGQLDKSFATNGFTTVPARSSAALAFDFNGEIVLPRADASATEAVSLARFDINGLAQPQAQAASDAGANSASANSATIAFAAFDNRGRFVVVSRAKAQNASVSRWTRFPATTESAPASRVVRVTSRSGRNGARRFVGAPLGSRVAAPLQELFFNFGRTSAEQNNARGLNGGAQTFTVRDNRVLVNIATTGNADAQLRALGFQQTGKFGGFVSGFLPIQSIPGLARATKVKFASPDYGRVVRVGATTSRGDEAQRSDIARTQGLTGAGQKIGVLSDSFNAQNGAQAGRNSGDLPNVQIIEDDLTSGNTDEGRAMLEIVHDVAPGASLAFATANNGTAGFAENILALQRAGCAVIVDDIGYFAEPMFMDGIVSRAVDQVVGLGAAYFSAAGNNGSLSYEQDYRNSGIDFLFEDEFGDTYTERMHDFDPGSAANPFQPFTIPAGESITVVLQWDEAFKTDAPSSSGAQTDLNFYVIDADKQTIISDSAFGNIGGDPVEVLTVFNSGSTPTTGNFAIGRRSGTAAPRLKYVVVVGNVTIDAFATNSSTSYGHPIAAGAAGVAAAPYFRTPRFGVTPPELESFSSRGGLQIRRNTSGAPISPVTRQKPVFTAPDGGNTSFFGQQINDNDSFPNFFGTSAAAPHAAGVAALMRQRNNGLNPARIYSALQNTAINIGPSGYDFDSGFGFINAEAAIAAVTTATPATYSVSGQVRAFFNNATRGLSGVTVTARRAGDNRLFTTTTDANGNYTIGSAQGLTAGTYNVSPSNGGLIAFYEASQTQPNAPTALVLSESRPQASPFNFFVRVLVTGQVEDSTGFGRTGGMQVRARRPDNGFTFTSNTTSNNGQYTVAVEVGTTFTLSAVQANAPNAYRAEVVGSVPGMTVGFGPSPAGSLTTDITTPLAPPNAPIRVDFRAAGVIGRVVNAQGANVQNIPMGLFPANDTSLRSPFLRFTTNPNGYFFNGVNAGSYIVGPIRQDQGGARGTFSPAFQRINFPGGRAVLSNFTFTASTSAAQASTSPVQISSASAESATSRVTLRFTGALNASASETARYTVTLNGRAVDVADAATSNGGATITLRLDAAFSAGDAIDVSWNGLRDAQGRALVDNSVSLAAR